MLARDSAWCLSVVIIGCSLGVPTPNSTSDIVRTMPISTIGSNSPSSRAFASSSIENESVHVLLKGWRSLPVLVGLGRWDMESSAEDMDSKFGPLNMKAAGDTKSTLGTEPCKDDLGFEPKLEALDLD
jgi:hypothetical protein